MLNERFALGKPANDLRDAGVLIRQFDTLDDMSQPWLPCPLEGGMSWCRGFSDRWATSIINEETRHVYFDEDNAVGGLVLAPTAVLFCAYPEDGNSMDPNHVCEPLGGDGVSCIPGCYPVGKQCHEVGHDWSCSFPPERLKDALRHQQDRDSYKSRNNEIVVDIRSITSRLPDSILAFWRKPKTHTDAVQQVIDAHTNFLHKYGLTKETGPPLLVLDLKESGSAPFSRWVS
jgi:hypothetical protein